MGLGLSELMPYLVIVGQLFILFKVFPFHCTNVQCIATPLYPNDLTLANKFGLSQGQSHAME